MKEVIKELLKQNKFEALDSEESLRKAAKELGYSEQEINEALENFEGFPIDDDDLAEIAGRGALTSGERKNHTILLHSGR